MSPLAPVRQSIGLDPVVVLRASIYPTSGSAATSAPPAGRGAATASQNAAALRHACAQDLFNRNTRLRKLAAQFVAFARISQGF